MEMNPALQCQEPHPQNGWRTPCRQTRDHPPGAHRCIQTDFNVLAGKPVQICKPCARGKHDLCPYFWLPPNDRRLCCCEPPQPPEVIA